MKLERRRSSGSTSQRGLPEQWFPESDSQDDQECERRISEDLLAAFPSSDEEQSSSKSQSEYNSEDVHSQAAVKELLAEYTTYFEDRGSRSREWMFT